MDETKGKIFNRLKEILQQYEDQLVVVHNTEDDYYLDTKITLKNKKPLYFGSVQIKKNYVSYYLMPIYVFPELANTISEDLIKRKQGKSCFNFNKIDEELFEELKVLTKKSYFKYEENGYID